MEEFSERSSLLSRTTLTSTSTIPGLGSLSGKVIKRLGQAVVNGVDSIRIRRRLGQIEEVLRAPSQTSHNLNGCYEDLLELSRPVYTFQIRERAYRILMAKIGAMEFESLAVAVAKLKSVQDVHEHLSHVLGCLWNQRTESSVNAAIRDLAAEKNLLAYRIAGLESYTAGFGLSHSFSEVLFYSPCLLYLALVASLGGPKYAQAVAKLNVVDFLRKRGVFDPSTDIQEGIAARLLLYVLVRTLDQSGDNSVSSYQVIISSLDELQHLHETQQPKLNNDLWFWSLENNISFTDLQEAVKDALFYGKTYILEQNRHEAAVANLLLLGAGECGKTTMMKQLILPQRPSGLDTYYSPEAIEWEVRNSLRILQQHGRDLLDRKLPDEPDAHGLHEVVDRFRPYLDTIRHIRQSARIGDEKTDYYLDLLDNLCSRPLSPYAPSTQDIIQCYVTTTGIQKETVILADKVYCIHDFGGQRSERKKWIHGFSNASLVIFVASLSEYDQVLAEEDSVNRLLESVTLFESICNSKWFTQTPIVLLLNKKDVLERKIEISPINKYFPDYVGGTDVDAACEYFKDRFKAGMRRRFGVPVYFLSSVNENEVRDVFHQIHRTFMLRKHSLSVIPTVA